MGGFYEFISNATVEQLLLWLDVTFGNAADAVRKSLDTALEQQRLPTDQFIDTSILVGLIQKYKIEKLYAWCEEKLRQHLEHLAKFKDNPNVEERKWLINNQLHAIYYLQKKYEIIESNDNLFFKGVLLLDSNKPREACVIFEQLLKSHLSLAIYLNLLYGYGLLLRATAECDNVNFEEYWAKSAKVIEQADALCSNWPDDQRAYYASHLVIRHELKHGEDAEYIRKIETRFQVRIDNLQPAEAHIESTDSSVAKSKFPTAPDMDSNHVILDGFSKFYTQAFSLKSKTYLQLKGILGADDEAYEIMLLKFVLQTQQHIHGYSTQLYENDIPLKKTGTIGEAIFLNQLTKKEKDNITHQETHSQQQ